MMTLHQRLLLLLGGVDSCHNTPLPRPRGTPHGPPKAREEGTLQRSRPVAHDVSEGRRGGRLRPGGGCGGDIQSPSPC